MVDQNRLPEGTDEIIDGAGYDDDADDRGTATGGTQGTAQGASGGTGADWSAEGIRATVQGRAQGLMDAASDHARAYVAQGLDYTTGALDDVIRMVEDAAGTIDDKVGTQYGDYARQASSAISGLADQLRMKDADALFDDAREAVRKSPAIAIGAAAALGFVVARIIKAGAAVTAEATSPSGKAPTLAEDDPIIPAA